MSFLDVGFFDEEPGFDLLNDDYYKLPFCDEDVKDLKNLCSTGEVWVEESLKEKLTCVAPHSPSSSSNSSGHSPLLLTERPDTPLMAVKFEDFSSGYDFHNLPFPSMEDEDIHIGDEMIGPTEMKAESADVITGVIRTGSERTVDCSLASTTTADKNAMITISKGEDGCATIHPTPEVKQETSFSFSRDQPVAATTSAPLPQFTATLSKPAQLFVCERSTKSDPDPMTMKNSPDPPKSRMLPQAKIMTNTFTHKTQIQIPTSTLQSILKNGCLVTTLQQQGGKIRIKAEPRDETGIVKVSPPQSEMPPTPPSSSSSDAEGSSSPKHIRGSPTCRIRVQAPGAQLTAQLLSPAQRFTQSHGPLVLTDEERRTMLAEGYSIPSKLPLSKSEEKSLKKVRRKIKNKLSAQESRRKKKEYVETLEKRMDVFNKENMDLKRKVDSLETSNRSLLSQLRSLQTLLAGKMPKPSRSVTTQTSSCLMMLVLCFAFVIGGWFPYMSMYDTPGPAPLGPYDHMTEMTSSNGWIVLSYEEGSHCRDEGGRHCIDEGGSHCHDSQPSFAQEEEWPNEKGHDTYDEPAGGRVTMNDTGEKIVRNTMEPRNPAELLASRKMVVKSARVEIVVDGETPHDVTKKIIVTSHRATQ